MAPAGVTQLVAAVRADVVKAAERVRPGADDQHGTLATITIAGSTPGTELERQIEQALAPFTVRHRIEWR